MGQIKNIKLHIVTDIKTTTHQLIMGKPRGIRVARKLRTLRREQRWHDLGYKKAHLGTALKPIPSEELLMLRELFLRRLVLKQNSPILPSESASVCNLSRMARRSQLSYPTMVVSTTLKRTTRFWCLGSDEKVTLLVIFPESDSRWSKLQTYLCWLCSRARRNDQDHKCL